MKGVVVTTDKTVAVRDFGQPLYKSVGEVVGGLIEIVRPRGLPRPYCMIVNDEGLLEGLPLNEFGSVLYGTQFHGSPIVGNIVIMQESSRNGDIDIVGLSDDEAERFIQVAGKHGYVRNEGGS